MLAHRDIPVPSVTLPSSPGAQFDQLADCHGQDHDRINDFWPNDGLDEGPVLMQKTCSIGPDETLGDVYFKKLFPMGVDTMMESLDLVKAGVVIRHDQRLDDGSYESWFGREQARLDWSRPVGETYNIIRAANPGTGSMDDSRRQQFKSLTVPGPTETVLRAKSRKSRMRVSLSRATGAVS